MSTTNRAVSSAHDSPAFFELLTRQGALDPEEAGVRRRYRMGAAVFVLLIVGHVGVALQGRTLGYQEEALGRLIHRLDQERVELENAVARESRPADLAARAVELGMQKPGHGQLRRLGASATAATSPIAMVGTAGAVSAPNVAAAVPAPNVAAAVSAPGVAAAASAPAAATAELSAAASIQADAKP